MVKHPPYHPYPWPVRFRKVREQMELAYMEAGQGEPVVLMVHGLGSYSPSWGRTMDGLKEKARCIAVDLPNYGRSSLGNFPVSLRGFAEILADFLDELDVRKPVVLAGHSMGAQIAIWAHHLNLFPVDRMILIAPAGFEQFSGLEKRWFSTLNRPGLIRNLSDAQIRRNFEVNFVRFSPDTAFMLEDRMKLKEHPEAYDLYCRMIPKCTQAMLDEPVWDLLPGIRVPTQVVFGLQDALIPNPVLHPSLTLEQVAWAGTKRIPGAHLSLIPNAGHFVHWEQPAMVNAILTGFLA